MNPTPENRQRISLAVGWSADSIDELLEGRPARVIDTPGVEARPTHEELELREELRLVRDELAELRQRVEALDAAEDEQEQP